jgi:hypothetical protein
MSKLKQLQKKLLVTGGIVLVLIGAAAGGMVFTGSMATEAETRKSSAESALNQDRSQLSNMKNQLTQSGDAEKRYGEILLKHPDDDFTANNDVLKSWLRNAKEYYRFGDNSFKLIMPLEKPSEKQGLPTVGFDVVERPGMKLELDAISDLHVYSFIGDMLRSSSGLVHLTHVEVTRKGDMNANTPRQLLSGLNPDMVNAVIVFDWAGVREKPVDATETNATPAPGGP